MNTTILFTLFLLIFFICGCTSLSDVIEERTLPHANTSFPSLTIHELKEENPDSGNFNVDGYVVKVYICPPCPKRALCKPCARENIVISEKNELLETYSLSSTELILFTNNPNQFELGKKYKFSIKILDYKTTSEPINNIEIIGYDYLEDN